MTWFKPDELSCQPMLDRSLVDKYRCIEYTEYRTFRDYCYPVLTIKMKTTKSKLPKRKISRTSVSSALVPTASADLEYLHNHSFSHEIPPMAEECYYTKKRRVKEGKSFWSNCVSFDLILCHLIYCFFIRSNFSFDLMLFTDTAAYSIKYSGLVMWRSLVRISVWTVFMPSKCNKYSQWWELKRNG